MPKFNNPIDLILNQTAVLLNRCRISPDTVTWSGLFFAVIAAYVIASGSLLAGAVFVALSGVSDLLDGRMSRLSNRQSRFGALLDSSLDRYGDGFIFAGIACHFYQDDNFFYTMMTLSACIGSLAVSYVKARAEGLGGEAKVGFWERGERIVAVLLGLVAGNTECAILFLGIFTHVTALKRLLYAGYHLNPSRPAHSAGGIARFPEKLAAFFIRPIARGTWNHGLKTVFVIGAIILLAHHP